MIVTSRRSGVPFRIVTSEKTETWRIAARKTSAPDFAQSRITASSALRTRTITASSGREVDERVALHLLVEVDVGLAHLVTVQTGMPRG